MTTEDPLSQETDADEWLGERVLSGEFEEIPMGTDEVQVDVPPEVEKFVRKRYQDVLDRDEHMNFVDLLMDHMNLQFTFILQEPAPEHNDWIIVKDDDEQ